MGAKASSEASKLAGIPRSIGLIRSSPHLSATKLPHSREAARKTTVVLVLQRVKKRRRSETKKAKRRGVVSHRHLQDPWSCTRVACPWHRHSCQRCLRTMCLPAIRKVENLERAVAVKIRILRKSSPLLWTKSRNCVENSTLCSTILQRPVAVR